MGPILTRHLSLGLTCAIAAGALVSLSNSRARRMTSARARASPLAAAAGADGFSEAMPAADFMDASVARCERPAGGRMVSPGGERPRLPHARGSFVH
jgi:hypothetical protein